MSSALREVRAVGSQGGSSLAGANLEEGRSDSRGVIPCAIGVLTDEEVFQPVFEEQITVFQVEKARRGYEQRA